MQANYNGSSLLAESIRSGTMIFEKMMTRHGDDSVIEEPLTDRGQVVETSSNDAQQMTDPPIIDRQYFEENASNLTFKEKQKLQEDDEDDDDTLPDFTQTTERSVAVKKQYGANDL